MIQRCTNPDHPAYHLYGGRGISICERWLSSFTDFLIDVGESPSFEHSLDRKDNNGNYEPGNIRWATKLEQTRNRRLIHREQVLANRKNCRFPTAFRGIWYRGSLGFEVKVGWTKVGTFPTLLEAVIALQTTQSNQNIAIPAEINILASAKEYTCNAMLSMVSCISVTGERNRRKFRG
jgi:hypothetical protein